MKKHLLEFKYVTAGSSGMQTVRNLNFSVFEGEYIGLIGARSAVSQTIYRLMTGDQTCSRGEIIYSGSPYHPSRVSEFQQKKIFCISSQSNLIDMQTIAENIFLNHSGTKLFSFVKNRLMINEAQSILDSFGLHLSAQSPVSSLSPAMKCIVEMIKFHALGARLVVLHDILSVGTALEYELFFRVVERFTASGASVMLLLNRHFELSEKADRLMLFSREGRLVRTLYQGEYHAEQIAMFLKAVLERNIPDASAVKGKEVLRIENLCASVYRNIDLEVHEKEVLGLYYSDNSLPDDLPLAISGSRNYTGQIYVCGESVTINTQKDAIMHGIGLIPADPGRIYFPDMTMEENTTILFEKRLSRLPGIIDHGRLKSLLQDGESYLLKLKTAFPSAGDDEGIYSVITRFSLYPFRVVFVMHPSKENDVIKTNMLFRYIEESASRGCGIIVASTRIEELEKICTRIHVL